MIFDSGLFEEYFCFRNDGELFCISSMRRGIKINKIMYVVRMIKLIVIERKKIYILV